jgi:hypothetical protein
MKERYKENLKKIATHWLFLLSLITALAIIIRSLPAWTNAAWGCDFGIYYGLTNSFVETKELFNTYVGWGGSYQYFPVLYAVTGVAHWITGIDVLTLMPKVAPIFGGLSILIFYFVVYELTRNRTIALLSSLILTVLPFHAYQTSHASPLTMGHFFMMLSLYLFLHYRREQRYLIPLLLSTMLLIMSHHFTTYFYLISLICIVFFENASRQTWTPTVKRDVFYVVLTSILVFSYWAYIATPVFDEFMNGRISLGGIALGSTLTVVLFYLVYLSSFGIIWMKRKLHLFLTSDESTVRSCLMKFSITVVFCVGAMGFFSVVRMPWTNFSFTPLSILFSLPLILVFGFAVAGFRHTRFVRNGAFVRGWLGAILLSFCFGLVTMNWAMFPHRHIEYMMAPLSVIAVYGIRRIFLQFHELSLPRSKRLFSRFDNYRPSSAILQRMIRKRQIAYVVVIIVLVASNAVSIYPAHDALNASYEVITEDNLAVIEWMKTQVDTQTSVIVSDHRLARMVESIGYNTTLDETVALWYTQNLSDYLNELLGIGKDHGRVTHVLIDDIMRNRVVHVGFGSIVYMTNASYDKFAQPPFELLYRNATLDPNGEEVHWTELYQVNWEYIEHHMPYT